METILGESVVRRRTKSRGQSWSVFDVRQVAQTDRQSICFTGGFLSLSHCKTPCSVVAADSTPCLTNKWRHSYACDGDTVGQVITKKLYSISEEENDVVCNAIPRPDGIATLSLS